MRRCFPWILLSVFLACVTLTWQFLPERSLSGQSEAKQSDPLPSWNASKNKAAILDFVRIVTDKSREEYVPPGERIAVFDNDGTLWVEQPIYTQVEFALDRIRAMAKKHPDWKSKQPFKAIIEENVEQMAKMSKKDMLEILAITHAGMTTVNFDAIAKTWLETAKHPRFQKTYPKLVYQPMLEVITYLQKNGFATYIVSGGGVDFMRAYAEGTYGIPLQNVIGSSIKTKWEMREKRPVLIRLPQLFFLDDKEDKPVAIELHIGRRPVIAFGNSDGDLQMLQWTAAGKGPNRMFIVHHDDGKREYAYDRKSKVGQLNKALDIAREQNWNLISMKSDWKQIFPK